MAVPVLNREDLIVSCSWQVLNDRSVENAVTVATRNFKQEKDLESMVSLESCIHLGTNNSTSPCTFEVKLIPRGLSILEICVVSEARIVEIYGQYGEYLTTNHADFIDDCEGMAVYRMECKLPQLSRECMLKFARLKTKGKMWLYGIHVTVDEVESSVLSERSVNFQNVNKILKESSLQLTEKADKCKKFLQMYYSSNRDNGRNLGIPNPQVVLKVLETEYFTRCNPMACQSVSKCFTDLFPTITLSPKTKNENEMTGGGSESIDRDISITSAQVTELKQYIDERFSQLQNAIFLQVEGKLNELQRKQNEKLDMIINLLDNLKNREKTERCKTSPCEVGKCIF